MGGGAGRRRALALDRAEQRIFALRDESANTQLRHIQAALQENFDHLSQRMERPYEVSGIPSGFREIDFYTEGFSVGDLVVIAARPSVGKTSLALAMAFNMAKRGHPTLVFSLEMDAKQVVSRFLAMNSRSDLLALRTGNVFDTEGYDGQFYYRLAIDPVDTRLPRGVGLGLSIARELVGFLWAAMTQRASYTQAAS